jgi:two-component system, NarL family, response regulator
MSQTTLRQLPIRILIADDHPIVRQGLAALIDRQPGMSIVAEANDGQAAVDLFHQHQPDVALIDLQMPNINGVTAIGTIHQSYPDARIIVLSTYDRDEFIYQGIRAGAVGYLLKDAEPSELLEAIRTVYAGQKRFASEVGTKLAERMNNPELSPREQQVIQLLASGKTNQEIGRSLHITESTVKFHINSLMTKLGVGDRIQVILTALRRGIVNL